MARGKGSAGAGVLSQTTVEQQQQQQQQVIYNDGIASRVQKRRRPNDFMPVSPEKRLKRERTLSPVVARRGGGVDKEGAGREVKVRDEERRSNSVAARENETERKQDLGAEVVLEPESKGNLVRGFPQEDVEPTREDDGNEEPQPYLQTNDEEITTHRDQEGSRDKMDNMNPSPIPHQRKPIYSDTGGPEMIADHTDWFRRQGLLTSTLLADQILEIVARCSLTELQDYQEGIIAGGFTRLSDISLLLERSKKCYGLSQPGTQFMEIEINTEQEEQQDPQIKRINVATAIAVLLQTPDVPLHDLQEHFIEIFMDANAELQDWQAVLLADLKSYCFVHGYETTPYTQSDEPYPLARIVEDRLKRNNPRRTLSTAEESLIGRCVKIDTAYRTGNMEFINQDLDWSKTVFDCLPSLKQFTQGILGLPVSTFELIQDEIIQAEDTEHVKPNGLPTTGFDEASPEIMEETERSQSHMDDTFDQDEMIRRAALAAHAALTGQPFPESYDSPMSYNGFSPQIHHFPPIHQSPYAQNPYAQELHARAASVNSMTSQQQNPTTAEQYERARLAATAKAAAKNKNAIPTPSQRRPWTQDEENALMTGLDRVQGPHWSQILAMYGAGGTISEILKDRNQVQLKDKARNLKLFFLKSGLEVPHYLKHVTGELKTRAPLTAAKNEARERLQEEAGEHKAADDAISVLVGGGRLGEGFGTSSSPVSEMGTPVPGLRGEEYGSGVVTTPVMVERYGSGYRQQLGEEMEEEEEEEGDMQDEMMADAIQQALAVGQQSIM